MIIPQNFYPIELRFLRSERTWSYAVPAQKCKFSEYKIKNKTLECQALSCRLRKWKGQFGGKYRQWKYKRGNEWGNDEQIVKIILNHTEVYSILNGVQNKTKCWFSNIFGNFVTPWNHMAVYLTVFFFNIQKKIFFWNSKNKINQKSEIKHIYIYPHFVIPWTIWPLIVFVGFF